MESIHKSKAEKAREKTLFDQFEAKRAKSKASRERKSARREERLAQVSSFLFMSFFLYIILYWCIWSKRWLQLPPLTGLFFSFTCTCFDMTKNCFCSMFEIKWHYVWLLFLTSLPDSTLWKFIRDHLSELQNELSSQWQSKFLDIYISSVHCLICCLIICIWWFYAVVPRRARSRMCEYIICLLGFVAIQRTISSPLHYEANVDNAIFGPALLHFF